MWTLANWTLNGGSVGVRLSERKHFLFFFEPAHTLRSGSSDHCVQKRANAEKTVADICQADRPVHRSLKPLTLG